MPPIPLLLSAGEASGDMYAARLATALQERADVKIFGMGGPQMRAAGVDIVTDYSEVSVVGITEILSHLPSLIRAMRKLVNAAQEKKPALAILTDFPGFHLRLARKLRWRGMRNAYYICPQFWAWRPWRVRIVRRRFALGLCIFPFDEKFYSDAGVPTKFIGHPLVDHVKPTLDRAAFRAAHQLHHQEPLIAVLPGSRSAELRQHLPVLREACLRIHQAEPRAQFVVAAAHGGRDAELATLREGWAAQLPLRVVANQTYDALAASDAAIVSSGTATVETALLAEPLVRTKFFSMVNLIAEKRVVPELIQSDFTPDRVAIEILALLRTPSLRDAMRADLAEVRRRLGPPGAVDRAADAILNLIRQTT